MKKLLTVAIAASALTAAVPALAQSYLDDRASQADQRIDNGESDGSLSVTQADDLRARLHDIERQQDNYRADGMANWQRRELNQRYDNLSSDITNMRHDEYQYRRDSGDVW
jgi:type II secretory pathway pseudopilin PulG